MARALSESRRIILDRREDILRVVEQGLPRATIAARFGISREALRQLLGEGKYAAVGPASYAIPDEPEEPEEEAPPPPVRRGEFRRWHTTADGLPEWGEADLPGYDAWRLVHELGLPAKTAMRRLGLRYPSEVLALLAQHKKGMDARRDEGRAA